MSYIGIIGAGRIDSSNSSYNLVERCDAAKQMNSMRVDMHIIKQQTGWEMGVDLKWRYEVADPFHSTVEIEDYIKRHYGEPINIRFCMHNTMLLTAYPVFDKLRLFARYRPERRTAGYFDPITYGMVICMGTANSPFDLQSEGVLLHEVQHLIQKEEGFAKGGNSSMGLRRYIRLAGEVEARNICHRHLLTSEQRILTLRSETQDIPDKEQIISFG